MFNTSLPKDPNLLLSMVNMKLRNDFSSLSDLAHHFNIDEGTIINTLCLHGYVYNPGKNQFIAIESQN